MSDLFWPGDERAGSLMTQSALLDAMVQVEAGWPESSRGNQAHPERSESGG